MFVISFFILTPTTSAEFCPLYRYRFMSQPAQSRRERRPSQKVQAEGTCLFYLLMTGV